jgi:hypothetical protein
VQALLKDILFNLISKYITMKRNRFLCLIIVAISATNFCLCKEQGPSSLAPQDKVDTVVKDIPLDKNGKVVASYKYKNEIVSKLKIDTLENGFDSIQIRIWYGYAFKDTAQLVIVKNRNDKWSADLYTLLPSFNKNRNAIESINSLVLIKEPKSGWIKFMKELFDLQIMTLPDMDKIAPNIVIADGDGVVVEVSTKNQYRFYHYLEPSSIQDKLPQAKRMENILQHIEKELDFKRLRQSGNNVLKPLPLIPKKIKLEPVKRKESR